MASVAVRSASRVSVSKMRMIFFSPGIQAATNMCRINLAVLFLGCLFL